MASTSQTASSNWQAMTAQTAKIASQKQEADNTFYVGYCIRFKPLLVYSSNNTLSGGRTRTMQTARTCNLQEYSQSLYDTVDI